MVLGVGNAGDTGGVGGCAIIEVTELALEIGTGDVISTDTILSGGFSVACLWYLGIEQREIL